MTTSEASSTSLALDASAAIEILLENRYAATGRGLHEKLSSAEEQIDELTVKRIRYIASARNAVVHRRVDLQNPDRFYKVACESIEILSGGDYSTPREVLGGKKEESKEEDNETITIKRERYFNSNEDTYLGLLLGHHKVNPAEDSKGWKSTENIAIYSVIFELIYLYCCGATLGKIGYMITGRNALGGFIGGLVGILLWPISAARAREVASFLGKILAAGLLISLLISYFYKNNAFEMYVLITKTFFKAMYDYMTSF